MILEVIDRGRLEKQESEERIDCIMPYLQDLVQKLNEIEVERIKSPMHIQLGR